MSARLRFVLRPQLFAALIALLVASATWSNPPTVPTESTQPQSRTDPIEYPTIPGTDPNTFNPIPPDAEGMPLGTPNPPDVEYKGPSSPSSISRDFEERVLEEIDLSGANQEEWQISDLPPDAPAATVTDSAPGAEQAFGALSFETTPWAFPRRVGVKLLMTHGANTRACSGTLIDPLHVLTAAHCMFPPGVGAWPNSIQVVPGYRVIGGAAYQPYGTANWTNVFYYTGWTTSVTGGGALAWNDDICVVRLDRHIGALTSWYPYGAASNCGFYKNNQHYSAGYPGGQFESPPGTCNQGRQQFWWQGRFDSCDTNWLGNWTGDQVRFNTESWNGQSGSGMYYINAQNTRVVTSVLSNGTCGGNNPTCPNPNCGAPSANPYTWDPLESTCRHASLSIL